MDASYGLSPVILSNAPIAATNNWRPASTSRSSVDVRGLLYVVSGADPARLALGVLLLALGHLGTALRFRACLRPLRIALPLRRIIDVTFLALLLNQLLSTGLGGDVVRVFAVGRGTSIARVIYASAADRAFGLDLILLNCLMAAPLYGGSHQDEIAATVYGTGLAMGFRLWFLLLLGRQWLASLKRRWRRVPAGIWNAPSRRHGSFSVRAIYCPSAAPCCLPTCPTCWVFMSSERPSVRCRQRHWAAFHLSFC
jgi:uncharacterized membrane protein YbhN (UPF0104 family)